MECFVLKVLPLALDRIREIPYCPEIGCLAGVTALRRWWRPGWLDSSYSGLAKNALTGFWAGDLLLRAANGNVFS
jgi:hypothetical protein